MSNQGHIFLTAKQVLDKVKTVDGEGSGLDADVIDGQDSAVFVKNVDYEDSDVLNKIKNVDGDGSGLDADLLDGQHGAYYAKSADLDAVNNDLSAHKSDTNNPHNVTASQLGASNLLTEVKKVDGNGSGLDADLLDGQHGTYYAKASDLSTHVNDTSNPHNVTASQLGAANILTQIKTVDGEGSGLDADTVDGLHASSFRKQMTTNVTVTVGSGGDFATINEALEYLVKTYYPIYKASAGTVSATIYLLSGFVMAEQVYVADLDLSWITIDGEDVETVIDRSALTVESHGYYSAFVFFDGAKTCKFFHTFTMNTSGDGSDRVGLSLDLNAACSLIYNAGFKNAGEYNIVIRRGSSLVANIVDFTAAGNTGILIDGASRAYLGNVNVSGCSIYGIKALNGSVVDASGGNVSQSGVAGILAENCSILNAASVNADSCYQGFVASKGARINAAGAHASGCDYSCYHAKEGGFISANDASGSSNTGYVFEVSTAGIIQAPGATGSLCQSANTITSDGLIIQ